MFFSWRLPQVLAGRGPHAGGASLLPQHHSERLLLRALPEVSQYFSEAHSYIHTVTLSLTPLSLQTDIRDASDGAEWIHHHNQHCWG